MVPCFSYVANRLTLRICFIAFSRNRIFCGRYRPQREAPLRPLELVIGLSQHRSDIIAERHIAVVTCAIGRAVRQA